METERSWIQALHIPQWNLVKKKLVGKVSQWRLSGHGFNPYIPHWHPVKKLVGKVAQWRPRGRGFNPLHSTVASSELRRDIV